MMFIVHSQFWSSRTVGFTIKFLCCSISDLLSSQTDTPIFTIDVYIGIFSCHVVIIGTHMVSFRHYVVDGNNFRITLTVVCYVRGFHLIKQLNYLDEATFS